MITKTRKQIIELISDYMDKTLSEGCLYLCGTYGIKKFLGKHINRHRNNWDKEYRYVGIKLIGINTGIESESSHYYDNDEEFKKEFEIIGHYDITAVLKYIKKKTIIRLFDIGEFYYSFELINKIGEKIGSFVIPNKPLHLYTDEEDKQLLELLLKLK